MTTEQAAARFGCAVRPMTAGDTNGALLLETDPPSVLKQMQSTPEARAELASLRALSGSGLTPELLDAWEESGALLVRTAFVSGENGQSLLDRAGEDASVRLYAGLGAILAVLHRLPPPDGLPVFSPETLCLPEYVPQPLRRRAADVLRGADASDRRFTHGDFGPHNVLWDGERLAVLDFEWAECGPAALDVGWLCWFTALHYASRARTLCRAFLAAYAAAGLSVPAADALVSCAVYKVCEVLRRAEAAPPEDRAEWVRRLGWTLDAFADFCAAAL